MPFPRRTVKIILWTVTTLVFVVIGITFVLGQYVFTAVAAIIEFLSIAFQLAEEMGFLNWSIGRLELGRISAKDIERLNARTLAINHDFRYVPRSYSMEHFSENSQRVVDVKQGLWWTSGSESKFLVGVAGVGKTVELSRILTESHKKSKKKWGALVVNCHLQRSASLEELIAYETIEQLKNSGEISIDAAEDLQKDMPFVIETLLRRCNYLIVDGMDRIEIEKPTLFIRKIFDFIELASKSKTELIMAMRDETFNSLFCLTKSHENLFVEYSVCRVLPLDNAQLHEAAQHYLKLPLIRGLPEFMRIPLNLRIYRKIMTEKANNSRTRLCVGNYIDLYNEFLEKQIGRGDTFARIVKLINSEASDRSANSFSLTKMKDWLDSSEIVKLKSDGIIVGDNYLQFFHDSFFEFLWGIAKLQTLDPTDVLTLIDLAISVLNEQKTAGIGKILYLVCILEQLDFGNKPVFDQAYYKILERLTKNPSDTVSSNLMIGITRYLKRPQSVLPLLEEMLKPGVPIEIRKNAVLAVSLIEGSAGEQSHEKARKVLLGYLTDSEIGHTAGWAIGKLSARKLARVEESDYVNNVSLTVKFPEDLSEQTFIDGNGTVLGVIHNPILLRDRKRINKLKKGKQIRELWGKTIYIVHGDKKFFWDWRAWPPSIDSLHFVRILLSSNKLPKDLHTVLDLGCGIGYLGISIFRPEFKIEHVHFADIDPISVEYAQLNSKLNNLPQNKTTFSISDAYENVYVEKYDATLCAAPYIPQKEGNENESLSILKEDPTTDYFYYSWLDTGLLRKAILEGRSHTRKLYFFYPKILKKEVDEMVKKAQCTFEVIGGYEVPLTIPFILDDSEWLTQLLSKGLTAEQKLGYAYWNDVTVASVCFG